MRENPLSPKDIIRERRDAFEVGRTFLPTCHRCASSHPRRQQEQPPPSSQMTSRVAFVATKTALEAVTQCTPVPGLAIAFAILDELWVLAENVKNNR
jgi:hypothetical protein